MMYTSIHSNTTVYVRHLYLDSVAGSWVSLCPAWGASPPPHLQVSWPSASGGRSGPYLQAERWVRCPSPPGWQCVHGCWSPAYLCQVEVVCESSYWKVCWRRKSDTYCNFSQKARRVWELDYTHACSNLGPSSWCSRTILTDTYRCCPNLGALRTSHESFSSNSRRLFGLELIFSGVYYNEHASVYIIRSHLLGLRLYLDVVHCRRTIFSYWSWRM